jgi:hypothetical protein
VDLDFQPAPTKAMTGQFCNEWVPSEWLVKCRNKKRPSAKCTFGAEITIVVFDCSVLDERVEETPHELRPLRDRPLGCEVDRAGQMDAVARGLNEDVTGVLPVKVLLAHMAGPHVDVAVQQHRVISLDRGFADPAARLCNQHVIR